MNNLYIYNTLTNKKEIFKSIEENNVKMYTCGPTLYNYSHIGNFRTYIFEDLLKRVLELYGYNVYHIMNFTDVDDKIIKNSIESKLSLKEYTNKYRVAFLNDLKLLNIKSANFYPFATEYIDDIIKMIKILIKKQYAYISNNGSVYFSIKKFKNYGKLSGINNKEKTISRINNDLYDKESISDFVLWKIKTKEDGDICWNSPWGEGRPGWHIECSAISNSLLGPNFDIHAGGVDNIFPHHENEIAQNESVNDVKFVNYWVHCEHLLIKNDKMAKSLNNFYTLKDILDKGFTCNEIRWVLLTTHYRSKLNFTFSACKNARKTLNYFNELFSNLNKLLNENISNNQNKFDNNLILKYYDDFKKFIGDDLDISKALNSIFSFTRTVNDMLSKAILDSNNAKYILEKFDEFNEILDIVDKHEFNFKFKSDGTEIKRYKPGNPDGYGRELLEAETKPDGTKIWRYKPGNPDADGRELLEIEINTDSIQIQRYKPGNPNTDGRELLEMKFKPDGTQIGRYKSGNPDADGRELLECEVNPDITKIKKYKLNYFSKNITLLLKDRKNARQNKDFKKADEIRIKLNNMGYCLKDTKYGTFITKFKQKNQK